MNPGLDPGKYFNRSSQAFEHTVAELINVEGKMVIQPLLKKKKHDPSVIDPLLQHVLTSYLNYLPKDSPKTALSFTNSGLISKVIKKKSQLDREALTSI